MRLNVKTRFKIESELGLSLTKFWPLDKSKETQYFLKLNTVDKNFKNEITLTNINAEVKVD